MDLILVVILLVFVFLLAGVAYLIASFGGMALFGSPFVKTPRDVAQWMLESVGLKEGEVLLDLGCGEGEILISGIEDFDAGKVYGVEIHPVLAWVARWRLKRLGVQDRMEIWCGNFFKVSYPKVDVLAVYLLPKCIDRMREKIVCELDGDTRVISRGFEFKGIEAREVFERDDRRLYLYLVEDLKK